MASRSAIKLHLVLAAQDLLNDVRGVLSGYDTDPGTPDLADEQPICVRMTLGEYRRMKRHAWEAEGRNAHCD